MFVLPVHDHWRELPQVSFLSRQNYVCRATSILVTTKLLLQQTYFCLLILGISVEKKKKKKLVVNC